jgi:hypothetical protein
MSSMQLGARAIGGGGGFDFAVQLLTTAGIRRYDLGRAGLPPAPARLMVSLGGLVLTHGPDHDFVFDGTELVLAQDPGAITHLAVRAALAG